MKLMNFYRKITLILSFILITNSKKNPILSFFKGIFRKKSKMLKHHIPHLSDIFQKMAQDPKSLDSSTQKLKDEILSKFLDESEIKCLKKYSQDCSIESLNNLFKEELTNYLQKSLNNCLNYTYEKCWPEYYSPKNQNNSNVKTPKQFYLKSLNLSERKINRHLNIPDNILSFYKNNFQNIIEFSLYVDLCENYVDNLINNANKLKCLIVDYNLKYIDSNDILRFVNFLNFEKNEDINLYNSNYYYEIFNKHSISDHMNLLANTKFFKFKNILADEIKKDDKSKRQTTITVLIRKLLGFIRDNDDPNTKIPFKLRNIKLKVVETYDLTEHKIDLDFTYKKLKIYLSVHEEKYSIINFHNSVNKILKDKMFFDSKAISQKKNTESFNNKKEHIINNIKSYLKTKFDNCNSK